MADDPMEGASTQPPAESSEEFDDLVLDDDFVRGGAYEPPARTRVAIARYGDGQTSWRHGGGLRRPPAQSGARVERTSTRRPRADRRGPARHPALPSPAMSRLPLIVTVIVVALAAILVFR